MSSNPYQTLEEANSGSIEYPFEGFVTEKELRKSLGTVGAVTFFGIGTVALGFVLLDELRQSFRSAGSLAAFFANAGSHLGLLLAVLCVGWLTWIQWTAPRRYARSNPLGMGYLKGTLTTRHLSVQTEHSTGRTCTEALNINQVTTNHLDLVLGVRWILPSSLFDDFDGAKQLATEIKSSAKPLLAGDERMTQPLPDSQREPAPPGAVLFEGPIMASDLGQTSFAEEMSRVRKGIVTLVTMIAVGSIFVSMIFGSWVPGVLLSGILLPLCYFRIIRPARKALRAYTDDDSDKVAHYVTGWITESGLTGLSCVGRGVYKWTAFESWALNAEETLTLKMPGRPAQHILLNRRQFGSEADWGEMQDLVRQHVQVAAEA